MMQLLTIKKQHGLVRLLNGKPITDSLAISIEFGRRHDNVLQSLDGLIKDGVINRLDFKVVKFTDAKGEQRRKIELTERGALIAMPFIGGRKSRLGQTVLVDAFLYIRDELINQEPWDQSRKAAATSYNVMCEALQAVRTEQGKSTEKFHYFNEAKMLNKILFGAGTATDRSSLSAKQCAMLEKMEFKNAILISSGKQFNERKIQLKTFALKLIAHETGKMNRQLVQTNRISLCMEIIEVIE